MAIETSEVVYTTITTALITIIVWLAYMLGKKSTEDNSNAFKFMIGITVVIWLLIGTGFTYIGLGEWMSKFIPTTNVAKRKAAEKGLTECLSAAEERAKEEEEKMKEQTEKDRDQFEKETADMKPSKVTINGHKVGTKILRVPNHRANE